MKIWNHYDSLYKKTDNLDAKRRVRAVMSLVSVPGLSRHHWGTDMDISEASLRGQLVNVHPDTPVSVSSFTTGWSTTPLYSVFAKFIWGNAGRSGTNPGTGVISPIPRVYEQQFMSIQDFHKILNDQVEDVHYLMENFDKVFKQETKSINTDCDLQIQN